MYYKGKKVFNILKPVLIDYEEAIGFAEEERQKSLNLFNGEFRQGKHSDLSSTNRIYSNQEIKLKANTTYTFSTNLDTSVYLWGIHTLENPAPTDSYITFSGWLSEKTYEFTPTQDCYCGVVVMRVDNGNIVPSDVSNYEFKLETYGATVHEKQLNNQLKTRELLYDFRKRISITNSTLTTLKEYFDLFETNPNETYFCNIGTLDTSNFKTLVGNPSGFANYTHCLIKRFCKGDSAHSFGIYQLTAYNLYGKQVALGYIFDGYYNEGVRFSGWQVIGG